MVLTFDLKLELKLGLLHPYFMVFHLSQGRRAQNPREKHGTTVFCFDIVSCLSPQVVNPVRYKNILHGLNDKIILPLLVNKNKTRQTKVEEPGNVH